jgi:hypothetical protein
MSKAKNLVKLVQNISSQGVLGTASVQVGLVNTLPTISSVVYNGDDTAVNIAGGDTVTLNGTNFNTGVKVLVNNIQSGVVTRTSSTQLTFTAPANSAGSYIIYVINTDGTTALAVPGLQYSGVPAWTTVAGSFGNFNISTSFSTTLSATGDAPVTYSVYSGSLPPGINLNSTTGVLSGTTPAPASYTTYNFVIRASDAQLQDTDRAFSLTVIPPTPVNFLVVAAGGNGGGANFVNSNNGGGGGGSGGAVSGSTNFNTGTVLTVNVGTTAGAGSSISATGFVRNAYGGGSGGSPTGNSGQPGNGGGSGGGGARGDGVTSTGGSGGAGGNFVSPGSGGSGGGSGGGGGGGSGGGYSGSGYGQGGGGAGRDWLATDFNNIGTSWGAGGPGASSSTAGTQGIVAIKYPDTFALASSTTGSPTVVTTGGYRIYRFTSSGSITF